MSTFAEGGGGVFDAVAQKAILSGKLIVKWKNFNQRVQHDHTKTETTRTAADLKRDENKKITVNATNFSVCLQRRTH